MSPRRKLLVPFGQSGKARTSALFGLVLLSVALGVAALIAGNSAEADRSPVTCTTNALNATISEATGKAVHGDTLTYTVDFTNTGAGACDVTDLTVALTRPNGVATTIVSGLSLAAGASLSCPGGTGCAVGPYQYVVSHADETGPVTSNVCPPTEAATTPKQVTAYIQSSSGTVHRVVHETVSLCKTAGTPVNHKPTLVTQVQPSTKVDVGTGVTDQATLSDTVDFEAGVITFTLYDDGTCGEDEGSIVNAPENAPFLAGPGPIVVKSTAKAALGPGIYSYKASYAGDANHTGQDADCEPFEVNPVKPSLVTEVHDADHNDITRDFGCNAGGLTVCPKVTVGATVHDQATLDDTIDFDAGEITFTLYSNGSCNPGDLGVNVIQTQNVAFDAGAGPIVKESKGHTILVPGKYSYLASYEGDTNHLRQDADCEPFEVNRVKPSLVTEVQPSTKVLAGTSVSDKATLSDTVDFEAGVITFTLYSDRTCGEDDGNVVNAPENVPFNAGPGPIVVKSTAKAALGPGGYSYKASYAGDANHLPQDAACEPFVVNRPTDTPTNTATRTNTPTKTATPTKTLTPTQTRATGTPTKEAGDPRGPSMSLLVYGDNAKTQLICPKGALARICPVPAGGSFSIDVKTGPAPARGFQGYQIVIQYTSGLTLKPQPGLGENRWPPCRDNGFEQFIAPTRTTAGRYILGCKGGPPPRTYKGVLANIHFTCSQAGTAQIDIVGGAGAQVSFYDRPSIYGNRIFLMSDPKPAPVVSGSTANKQVADDVRIQCGQVVSGQTAGDTDGDGCTDKQEKGSNEMLGGQRDYTNPWDFFDPTKDGRHRLDDVIAVLSHYNEDLSTAGYSTDYDRSFLGPNAWNLGPPSGDVGIDDIATMVKLYHQDCK